MWNWKSHTYSLTLTISPQEYLKTFSINFIFRQQKILSTTRIVRLKATMQQNISTNAGSWNLNPLGLKKKYTVWAGAKFHQYSSFWICMKLGLDIKIVLKEQSLMRSSNSIKISFIYGAIQQLRGPNFTQFWPSPSPLPSGKLWTFYMIYSLYQ